MYMVIEQLPAKFPAQRVQGVKNCALIDRETIIAQEQLCVGRLGHDLVAPPGICAQLLDYAWMQWHPMMLVEPGLLDVESSGLYVNHCVGKRTRFCDAQSIRGQQSKYSPAG
ncbi:hypothetical protein [Pseudomonas putida]|uniref:hypothetical protein n=1 Tax=Pseudomonas putida TaxID=303 RepID=UPI002B24534A|nr:hypothetical protein [Pseudomonas putida]